MKFLSLVFFFISIQAGSLYSSNQELPFFIGQVPSPNAYSLFANGGWNGNWYVGYNTCWVQKISVPAKGSIKRAFVGAKLGRAKSIPTQLEKPWIKKPIPGEIFVALSSTLSWKSSVPISLVSTEEIPLEGDMDNAVEGVGESRWFWKEVPLNSIQFEADNFIALWSPTEQFQSEQTAPILAGAWGNNEINSWLVQGIEGAPPTRFKSKQWQPVTVFEPAIALKLIPEQTPPEPKVSIERVVDETALTKLVSKVLWCSAQGESIERAWVELSEDGQNWQRYGKFLWEAPFVFRVAVADIPIGSEGKSWVRVKAVDLFENVGTSSPMNVFERR